MNARWAYALMGVGFILLALGFGAFSANEKETDDRAEGTPMQIMQIGSAYIPVEVVDTPALRTRGLSGRESFAEDTGMLFIFEMSGIYGFWMPDMHFAIDIIWISAENKVVYIKENATPQSYPETFTPTAPALYVLEVPAGFVKKWDIQEGQIGSLSE